ncbi:MULTISPECIES: TetR/AcrR family transcriptional regulator [unclassified Bordetella]|uniref:TetR/AcrR family transcriptional regulator n=1 Tax=unclassified Bordetella TaxID=2630031 RepID=UPI0013234239|nr:MULTISPECIES: TetR/AcrR family transcriptional regulator [unclassified Bordetella]MVW72940.1 TetR family transcriptional regulator [Bordetella sp. 15P40C-2]MVW80134.1 TetR family transcriptional regulator [Bordetella sp. 02P26C-1]
MAKKKQDKEASVEKIERAALMLFARYGYTETSLEQVADEAGFTKGAVYYYFKTKEALLVYLLDRIRERSILRTQDYLRAHTGTAVDKLVAFVQQQAIWAAKNPDDLVILILTSLQFRETDTPARQSVRAYYGVMTEVLTEIFSEGVKKGELSRTLDIETTVLANIARHDGNMLLWYRSGRDPEVGRKLTQSSCNAVRRFGVELA